ncbi:MAG: FAD-dependent oxidoreductase [Bacteroidota bacterium]|nr:FAD-dependent oxidoreductase [Bacteroidota bacterium]
MALRDWIKKRLKNYKISLNTPDTSLDLKITAKKKVAVIGSGIAGIAAAANLAERGFDVHLFERESYIGGKVGSWTFDSKGETFRTEHGFHAFFRQYYNLRGFMQKIGAFKHLIPIDDYVILYDKNKKQRFKGLETTPGLNIWALRKHGIFGALTFLNPMSVAFINLLRFDFEKTYEKFDSESFAHFANKTFMPLKMRLVFNSFSRAFFAEPEDMSMAELIKSFHFYFLSNDQGLVYDVLDDDFEHSFLGYCREFIEQKNGKIHLNTPVEKIEKTAKGFVMNDQSFDYAILCTDVKATKKIIQNSPELKAYKKTYNQLATLKQTGYYAVYRLWTDRYEADPSLPFFIFIDRLKCLDSVTLYHKMEKASAQWSKENKGGIFELHSYIVPKALNDPEAVKQSLLDELHHYFPELEGMAIKHEYFQFRNDFPGFHVGEYENRPTVETEIPGLFLAGDWVKMDNCTMLMEAAYTSGTLAANAILEKENLQTVQLFSVPPKGLLA